MADNQRMRGIIDTMQAALTPVKAADQEKVDAASMLKGAREGATGAREGALLNVAKLAAAQAWTDAEIHAASKQVAADSNSKTEKSVATFIGELKLVSHPKVRGMAETAHVALSSAWEEEGTLDKSDPRPLRALWARKYHAWIAILGLAQKGMVLADAPAMIDFARANDPNLDAEKVHKRLQTIIGSLQSFADDFPMGDLATAIQLLNMIGKRELMASRVSTTVVETPKAAPNAPAVVTHTTPANSIEPAEGVFDPLAQIGALLNDGPAGSVEAQAPSSVDTFEAVAA